MKGIVLSAHVSLAPDLIQVLKDLDKPLDQTVAELIVLELYREGRLSSGKAAELLGLSRLAFIQYASSRAIPFFDLTEQELLSDIENVANARDRRLGQ